MTLDALTLTIAARLVTRRWRRNYTGKRRADRGGPTVPGDYLLSPAAYQTATGTDAPVHADIDQPTAPLNRRIVRPTNTWTVNGVNTGGAR